MPASADNHVLSIVKRDTPARRIPLNSHGMYFVSWMFFGQNISLLFACYMGVNLGGYDGTMAEQPLDISDIDIIHITYL